MKKNTINYIVDWIAFLIFLVTFITGIMRFSAILSFIIINIGPVNVNLLNSIHRWSGVITGIMILIHLILHWRWVKNNTKILFRGKKNKRPRLK